MSRTAAALLAVALALCCLPVRAEEIVAPAVRNVTPPGMTPGPSGDGPLIREPTPPRPPDPPRWRRYFLPVTTDAATFLVKGLTIRIAGVAAPPVDETCRFADGTGWPCGRAALFSFRRFLHGRAVECFFPPPGQATDVVAPCRIGRVDLGEWLLEQGWARPNDIATDAYRSAAKEAECTGAGIWREAPKPASCPPAG